MSLEIIFLERMQNSTREVAVEAIYNLLIESSTIVNNNQQEQNEILNGHNCDEGSKL